jgi:hypothetical protein
MDYELLAVVLGAVLPIYPALFGIYLKIGRYDVLCEMFSVHLKECPPEQEFSHGTGDRHLN